MRNEHKQLWRIPCTFYGTFFPVRFIRPWEIDSDLQALEK